MNTTTLTVPYNYLAEEYGDDHAAERRRKILADIEHVVVRGDFTLGKRVAEFEEAWAQQCGTNYAVGVGSGTDALKLLLRAIGVKPGEGVITSANTFIATVGAILEIGAEPVLIDIGNDFLMAPEGSIRINYGNRELPSYPKWRIPVHWGGNIAYSNKLHIEDASQAMGATWKGHPAGSLGIGAAFSLHPIKNVMAWGDGGMVTTNDEGLAEMIRLLRNHGLTDRDTCVVPGYNSRLHTIQAIVGLDSLQSIDWVTMQRNHNARQYDAGLADIKEVTIPYRDPNVRQVYHLYQIEVERRDDLITVLQQKGVEAKIHYPTPLHLQPGLRFLGYKDGDFPRAEAFAKNHITLPVHQFLSDEQMDYVIECIRGFYEYSR